MQKPSKIIPSQNTMFRKIFLSPKDILSLQIGLKNQNNIYAEKSLENPEVNISWEPKTTVENIIKKTLKYSPIWMSVGLKQIKNNDFQTAINVEASENPKKLLHDSKKYNEFIFYDEISAQSFMSYQNLKKPFVLIKPLIEKIERENYKTFFEAGYYSSVTLESIENNFTGDTLAHWAKDIVEFVYQVAYEEAVIKGEFPLSTGEDALKIKYL